MTDNLPSNKISTNLPPNWTNG